jgi:hypothetical protein
MPFWSSTSFQRLSDGDSEESEIDDCEDSGAVHVPSEDTKPGKGAHTSKQRSKSLRRRVRQKSNLISVIVAGIFAQILFAIIVFRAGKDSARFPAQPLSPIPKCEFEKT